jgi:outer membrane protein TolC
MRQLVLFLLCVFFLTLALRGQAYAQTPSVNHPLSLRDVLALAEGYSPGIKASAQEELAADQAIRERQSRYYPTLDALVVDSAGFPASAGAPQGFDGLMLSPYRVGVSGGVFTTVTFFDVTREYGVQAARLGLHSAREQTQVSRLQVDLQAMNLYMDAIVSREQRDAWTEIQGEIDQLYKLIKKYVKNGQYSEVTQWLLKDQNERALRNQEVFDQHYRSALRRIEILTGSPEGSIALADTKSLDQTLAKLFRNTPEESPLVKSPKFRADTAHAVVSQQSALNYPRIVAVGSAGGMHHSRLVPVDNYSGWIGLTVPIFEGFKISAEEKQAEAEAQKSDDLLDQARLGLADTDTKYAEDAKAREIEVRRFQTQREYSLKALKLSERRYVGFVGSLPDVRDSLYAYEDAESGLNQSRAELYRAQFAQAIVDGATISSGVEPLP